MQAEGFNFQGVKKGFPPLFTCISSILILFRRILTAHGSLNLFCYFLTKFRIVGKHILGGIASLRQFASAVAEPRTALGNDSEFHSKVYNFTYTVDALAEGYFELCLTEWRSYFVFYYLNIYFVSDNISTHPEKIDPVFQLFPSVFLSYQIPNDHELQVNYTKRVRRPWGGQLN